MSLYKPQGWKCGKKVTASQEFTVNTSKSLKFDNYSKLEACMETGCESYTKY